MTEETKPVPRDKPTRSIASAVLSDGALVEMVFDREHGQTQLCVSRKGTIEHCASVIDKGLKLVPYSPHNNLLVHNVILFPTEATDFGSEADLLAMIRTFIHDYADVSPLFERIASYYVLLSWLYDSYNELPYLRVRGDTGSGKTRCLLTVGSLCYKPIFASGASTVSPIFRILDSIQGTLIVDEGDFRFSDEKAEIIKILNNGNARGFPVLRSESTNGKEFSPKAYSVFGPKMIATRNYFEDRALETRCLTEETGGRPLRTDIPLNLDAEWTRRSLDLRNRLLAFRFATYGKRSVETVEADRSIEPRLSQLFMPLLSVVQDPAERETVWQLARDYNNELIADRGMDTEAQILETIREAAGHIEGARLSIKEITDRFDAKHGDDYERKITAKWVGSIVRRSLQLRTHKSNGTFIVSPGQAPKLARLYEKYGIAVN